MERKVILGFLMIALTGVGVYAQMVFSGPTNEFKMIVSGQMSGMMSIGLHGDDQNFDNTAPNSEAPGVYYPNERKGSFAAVGSGKNGYYNNFDLAFLLSPWTAVELYAKFKTRYQTGSPYLPFQLDSASKEDYSIKTDSAWARVNVVDVFRSDFPLEFWLKVGKFNAEASNFNRISGFGVDGVLEPLQTGTHNSFQVEIRYPVPTLGPLALSFTTNLRLNEELKEYYDSDSKENILSHYNETGLFAKIPIHLSLKMPDIDLSIVKLQAELLYGLNALHIFSGHSFGAGISAKINVLDNLSIPIGVGAAITEKNIDPFTSTSRESSSYEPFYRINGYSKADSYTLGLRQSLRVGVGAGVEFSYEDIVKLGFNAGFTYSQLAHIYRETLNLFSLSLDIKALFIGKVLFGAGIFMGSLTDAEWKVKEGINVLRPGETEDRELFEGHTFGLLSNLGFEVYTGIQMRNSRFILGYNMNRGISMNKYLEALPDAQIKYRQKDTKYSDGMFERGGVFAKLVINL